MTKQNCFFLPLYKSFDGAAVEAVVNFFFRHFLNCVVAFEKKNKQILIHATCDSLKKNWPKYFEKVLGKQRQILYFA